MHAHILISRHALTQSLSQGNFLDHLNGVYKILRAWKQPLYVCHAGMFHSVYGTYDYRTSQYFDLRRGGRAELRAAIGPAAEELSFAICTSDRLGAHTTLLIVDIFYSMLAAAAAAAAAAAVLLLDLFYYCCLLLLDLFYYCCLTCSTV